MRGDMITVYHQQRKNEDSRLWDPMFDEGAAPWPDHYKKVAEVETDDLEHAWQQTNHIDRSWTDNEDVKAEPGPHRSSMVGDVFVAGDKRFMVMGTGFEELQST